MTWNDGKLLNGGVAVATEWAKQVVENGKKKVDESRYLDVSSFMTKSFEPCGKVATGLSF